MNIEQKCIEKYHEITKLLIQKNITITLMESCTSGTVASLFTDTDGASAIFKGSFVTYSNETKILCGVPEDIIDDFGVYSKETAQAMAHSSRKNMFDANIGIGITGSIGNADSSNKDSVPGEVWFAIDFNGDIKAWFINNLNEKDKHWAKFYIADKIADQLFLLLHNI